MKEKITIYTSKTCPYCDTVKDKLQDANIKFTEIDIIEHKKTWNGVVNLTANPVTPTIEINGEFLLPGRDFQQPEQLVDVISNFKKSKYDDNRRILELLKTLNFNIFTAFNRMQHVLQQITDNTKKEEENEHKSTS